MKKCRKDTKGITLIALVITIVILLILSAVTISTLTGDNGLFARVKEAQTEYIKSDMREQLVLELMDLQAEKLGEATLDDVTQDWIDGEITEYTTRIINDASISGKKVIMKRNGVIGKFIIDENLDIIESEFSSEIEFIYEVISKDGDDIEVLITVISLEKGIQEIELPDGTIEQCEGAEEKEITYTVEFEQSYTIKITLEDGTEEEGIILVDEYYYTVTKNLDEGIEIDNNAVKAKYKESYIATVTTEDGYELETLTVTMGGEAVEVDVETGKIEIETVTGDIEITATAVEITKGVATDVAKNPTTYYGAVVTNYTVADSDLQEALTTEGIQWKIFYADSDNIYLIASDYVPVENAPSSSTGSPVYSSSYPYSLYLKNVYTAYSGASDIEDDKLTKLNSLFYESYPTSTSVGMRCVAYLMDTSLWSDYANTSYATYAIGGATLEMWVASWNAMGYTKLYCDNVNVKGYCIGKSSSPTGYSLNVTSSNVSNSGYGDTLYFPHQNTTDRQNCKGYCLASPTCQEYDRLVIMYYSGIVTTSPKDYLDYGFRPLVCLNSDIQLQDNGDGTYSIVE